MIKCRAIVCTPALINSARYHRVETRLPQSGSGAAVVKEEEEEEEGGEEAIEGMTD